jgi:hypothetical protein
MAAAILQGHGGRPWVHGRSVLCAATIMLATPLTKSRVDQPRAFQLCRIKTVTGTFPWQDQRQQQGLRCDACEVVL